MSGKLKFESEISTSGNEIKWWVANTGEGPIAATERGASVILCAKGNPTPVHFESLTLGRDMAETDQFEMFTYLPAQMDGDYELDVTVGPDLGAPQTLRCEVTVLAGTPNITSQYRYQ